MPRMPLPFYFKHEYIYSIIKAFLHNCTRSVSDCIFFCANGYTALDRYGAAFLDGFAKFDA